MKTIIEISDTIFENRTRGHIEETIKNSIELNKKLRNFGFARRARKTLSLFDYVINFCVVRINLGRGSGKSIFIEKNAEKNDLIISASPLFFRNKKKFKDGAIFLLHKELSLDKLQDTLYGRSFDNIYIDEPSLVLQILDIELNDFFHQVLKIDHGFANRGGTFILFGEWYD